jgi:predicted esterase
MAAQHKTITFKKEISFIYDLYQPLSGGPLPLLVALHGYGENKEIMMDLLKGHLKAPCIIASLQAPFPHIVPPVIPGRPIKYGFGWITSFNAAEAIALHHSAVDQVISDLAHNKNISIGKIVLLGFSQSVALNFRYVFSRPQKINKLIAICGGLPGDWQDKDKYAAPQTDILYIGCKKDLIYPARRIRENTEKLKPRCRSAQVEIYDAGHIIPRDSFGLMEKFIFD